MADRDWQKALADRRTLELQARRLLGVRPIDGPEEIRRAFRRLAHESHPDHRRNDPEAARTFTRLLAAYKLLVEGVEPCVPLVAGPQLREREPAGKYRETQWGYFAWWQESFPGDALGEQEKRQGRKGPFRGRGRSEKGGR